MSELTLEQQRALFAMEVVDGLSGKELDSYRDVIKGFPATVLMNGLGQALALLLAKKHDRLYNDLQMWLCDRCPFPPYGKAAGKGNYPLMDAIMNGSQDQYVQAQAEVNALVGWLKKFTMAAASKSDQEG